MIVVIDPSVLFSVVSSHRRDSGEVPVDVPVGVKGKDLASNDDDDGDLRDKCKVVVVTLKDTEIEKKIRIFHLGFCKFGDFVGWDVASS